MVDLLGHLGYLFLVVGHLAIARKMRFGFLFRVVGGLLWAGIGYYMGLSSILVWSFLFSCIDLYGWRKWRETRISKGEGQGVPGYYINSDGTRWGGHSVEPLGPKDLSRKYRVQEDQEDA
jgi:hypothetical protein